MTNGQPSGRTVPSRIRQFANLLSFITCGSLLLPGQEAALDEYERTVAPILKQNCASCHSDRTRTSGFSVATKVDLLAGGARRGTTVMPGNADESVLMKVLKGHVEPRMPLGAPPLSDDKIAPIAAWIKSLKPTEISTSGTGWWAVRPLEKGEPPALGAANGIDQFIRKKLEENKLSNAPEAARQTLLRRAHFDLIGLPPTTSEVEAFLNDKSPDAYEKLIERLLADPRYGERWGRHWLDLARYADTRGYEGDLELSSAWRYRDYVIDSFNKDKPYDHFIKEQIAGDELTGGGAAMMTMTTMLRGGSVRRIRKDRSR